MKLKHMIAAAAVFAAGSAFADDTYPYVDHSRFVGTKTRAQVQAEMDGAGSIASRQQEYVEHTHVAAGKTRSEVRAELERLYAEGTHAANRMPEYVEFTQVASTRSRADVQAEATQAVRGAAASNAGSGS